MILFLVFLVSTILLCINFNLWLSCALGLYYKRKVMGFLTLSTILCLLSTLATAAMVGYYLT